MNKFIIILFSAIILNSCSNLKDENNSIVNELTNDSISDTLVIQRNITNEIAGSNYRKRATGYSVVIKQDTSKFMPVFFESKSDQTVGINPNYSYSRKEETYIKRLSDLKLILLEASKDYNLDSLKGMYIGRLILTGDLAITITTEYKDMFGDKEKIAIVDYQNISDFLLESTLTNDFNELFEPYSKEVASVVIEKAHFTSKKELYRYSNISIDTSDIPNKILDFMTWIEFRNK